MGISIPQKKWIEIYNSISLFWFIIESNQKNPTEISSINQAYNKFCQSHGIPGEGFNVTAPENFILFGYAIVVRIKEIIDPAIKGKSMHGEPAKEFIFKAVFEAANSYGCDWFTSYSNIISSQSVVVHKCTYSDKPEHEKLYKFITHLRHSIAHSTYEMRDGGDCVYFKSTHAGVVHLEASMPIHAYINIVLYFGVCLNRVLHQENILVV